MDEGINKSKKQRLMVYGTLRKGFHNHDHYMGKADYLGDYEDLEGIMFHAGGFPAITIVERRVRIFGEIYELTYEEMRAIDGLEHHPTWYKRQLFMMGQYGPTWTYVWPKEVVDSAARRTIVPSGRWEGSQTLQREWYGWGKGWEPISPPKGSKEPTSGLPVVTRLTEDGKHYIVEANGTKHGPYRCLGDLPPVEDLKTTPIGDAIRQHLRGGEIDRSVPVPVEKEISPPEEEAEEEFQGFGPGASIAKPKTRIDKGGVPAGTDT